MVHNPSRVCDFQVENQWFRVSIYSCLKTKVLHAVR